MGGLKLNLLFLCRLMVYILIRLTHARHVISPPHKTILMFTDFYRAFYYSVLIIAAAIGLLYIAKVDKAFRWICLLLILTTISELVARYFKSHHENNNIVYVIFTPVEYFVYAMIYKMFFDDKKWTKILFISVAGLIFLELINTIFFQPISETPTNIMDIESVLLVILSLKLFISIREKPVFDNILKEGVFWFNSAVLFYYSFDILFWGFHNLVFRLENPPAIIYNSLLLFSGFLYLVFALAVLLNFNAVTKTIITA